MSPAPHSSRPRRHTLALAAGATLLALGGFGAMLAIDARAKADDKLAAAPKAALTVTVVAPQQAELATVVEASGSIAAWQEASVGTEANGLRLAEVRAGVGDRVRRGQVLAVFAADTVRADVQQARASVAEAEATLAEAAANAQRARDLQATGALSAQQIAQFTTAERTAQARLDAVRAMLRSQELRLQQTQVLAPDDGLVSARSATVGAVMPAGQEMFRLIRQGRLEWRAEVPAADLARMAPGQAVVVQPAGGGEVTGRVRIVAPTVDAATRNGLVYVDLPSPGGAKAGMFARGRFTLGQTAGLTLPSASVLLRDGFPVVLVVGADDRVAQKKVTTGRRSGDRIEVTAGLDAGARVVATGGGFLAGGDLVRVVNAPAPGAASAATAKGTAK
jgi:RND family efflux transporter MFP subunit